MRTCNRSRPSLSSCSRGLENLTLAFRRRKGLEPLLRSLFQNVHDISMLSTNGGNRGALNFSRKTGAWFDIALANPSLLRGREATIEAL